MATFKAHDRVAILGETTPLRRGEFIGWIGQGLQAAVLVDGYLEQVKVGDLVSADQIAETERRIREDSRRLQVEFETAREQIREKLQVAADNLREASKLALDHDMTLHSSEFYEEVRPFLRAFDDTGWSSSSLNC